MIENYLLIAAQRGALLANRHDVGAVALRPAGCCFETINN